MHYNLPGNISVVMRCPVGSIAPAQYIYNPAKKCWLDHADLTVHTLQHDIDHADPVT